MTARSRPPSSDAAARARTAAPALDDTGYHMLPRDLDAGPVLADIAAWIKDRDAPLPSGRERAGGQLFAAE